MAAIGGPIQEVSIKGRIFSVAEDADMGRKLGGYENDIQMNGNGTGRQIKTRVAWMLDGLTLNIDDDQADLEFLQDVADGSEDVDITATTVADVTFGGSGTITGEIKASAKNATAGVTLSGPGKLEQQ